MRIVQITEGAMASDNGQEEDSRRSLTGERVLAVALIAGSLMSGLNALLQLWRAAALAFGHG